jgi:hypothetical protein
MKQTWVKAGKWALVVLFASYYVSTTSFYHTHYFSWGTVTHSHLYFPFGENTPNHHTHTQNQCQLIACLSNIVLVCLTAAFLTFWTRPVRRIFTPVRCHKSCTRLISPPLRAPPAFLSR